MNLQPSAAGLPHAEPCTAQDRGDVTSLPNVLARLKQPLSLPDQLPDGSWQLIPTQVADLRVLIGKFEQYRGELRDARNDLLDIRGVLSPADQPSLRVVPMELGERVAPAVQCLVDEVLRLRELAGEPASAPRQTEA